MAETLSLDDFKNQLEDFVKELEENPDKINELTDEQAIEVDKYLNPYGATLYGDEKYTCVSFTNLKEKYMQRLLTTALIGFVYQICDEYEIEDEDLTHELNKDDFYDFVPHPDKSNSEFMKKFEHNIYLEIKLAYLQNTYGVNTNDMTFDDVEKYELTEDEELQLLNNVKEEMITRLPDKKEFNADRYVKAKQELVEQQSKEEQKVIKRFLNKLFKYNPKDHTTSAYNENHNDPERNLKAKNQFTEIIPPNDTYGRFQYYYDVNYEELREAVLHLYAEKPDMEVAINIYETFDSIDECNEYINKNKDKVITNIMTLTNYKWNLLGSFKKNRERITFYNEHTQILENILKQQEEDAKLGKKLLDERVRKRKVKNVKEYGKTDPAVAKYLKENPNEITTGASKVEITDDKVIVTEEFEISEHGAKVDADGTPEDAIEIGVTSINLKSNKISTSTMYTKAHKPDEHKQ
jgi:hypothetical protein